MPSDPARLVSRGLAGLAAAALAVGVSARSVRASTPGSGPTAAATFELAASPPTAPQQDCTLRPTSLRIGLDRVTTTWAGDFGPFDVARGMLSNAVPIDFAAAQCLEDNTFNTSAFDPAFPEAAQAFWYLVRCWWGSWNDADGTKRVIDVCE